jgi:hypothetical protein
MLKDMLKDKVAGISFTFGKSKKEDAKEKTESKSGDLGLSLAKAFSDKDGVAIERLVCEIVAKNSEESEEVE